MAVFSVVYISAVIIFFRFHLGDASLVYANILNLSVRILYSIYFITSFYRRRNARHVLKWSNILPRWSLLFVVGASMVVVKLSQKEFDVNRKAGDKISLRDMAVLIHIGIGACMAMISLGVWWMSSGRYSALLRRSKTE